MQQQPSEGLAQGSRDREFTCPDCGGHSFTTILHTDAFEYGAGEPPVTLNARVPVHCCDSCEFEFLGPEGRLIKHEAVCRHLELLTPTEIRRIRERHGMSRAAFAEITGLGEATLNRWENGAVIQNRANDHYLWLLESPHIFQRVRNRKHCDHDTVLPSSPDGGKPWQYLQVSPTLIQRKQRFRLAA